MDYAYFLKDFMLYKEAIVGVLVIYIVIIVLTRIIGLKSFSKMSSYDFAHTIAVGSLIASSIATGSPSLFVGILLITLMFFIKFFISFLMQRFDFFGKIINNTPIYLMKGEKILYENLKSAEITENELIAKLREANVLQLSEVKAVVLEATGDVSVLHGDCEVDDIILKDVAN